MNIVVVDLSPLLPCRQTHYTALVRRKQPPFNKAADATCSLIPRALLPSKPISESIEINDDNNGGGMIIEKSMSSRTFIKCMHVVLVFVYVVI